MKNKKLLFAGVEKISASKTEVERRTIDNSSLARNPRPFRPRGFIDIIAIIILTVLGIILIKTQILPRVGFK